MNFWWFCSNFSKN